MNQAVTNESGWQTGMNQAGWQAGKQTSRRADRQAYRHTDRQAYRQAAGRTTVWQSPLEERPASGNR